MSTENSEPREAAFFTTIRSWGIVRGPQGILGGVIAALGARVGLAPWPARIIVILAGLVLFPLVMLGYAAGWALLPDAEGNIVIQNFGRGVMNVGALIGIAIFALVGFLSFSDFRPFGRAWFGPDIASVDPGTPFRVIAVLFAVLVPLAVIAGIVAVIVLIARRSTTPSGAAANAAHGGAAPVYAVPRAQAQSGAPAGSTSAAASGSASTATAAAPTATAPFQPVVPAAPPRPPAPRVPGPGRGFYLTALAWAFLAAAVIAWSDREDLLSVYPILAWGMLFLTGLGVILIAVSLSGRRLGFLGFLGLAGLVPALILLAGHESILKAYERNENPADAVVDVAVEPSPFDATAGFASAYDAIFLGGYCYEDDSFSSDASSSTARIAVADPFEEDATHDILAATTTVIMPQGTSLEVSSTGSAQATVFFADRDLTCSFDAVDASYVSLINAGDPVLSLNVIDDNIANTIIIEEN